MSVFGARTTPDSTTIHLRITLQLKDAIQKRADQERRTWTQMATLMLQDAAEKTRKPKPAKETTS